MSATQPKRPAPANLLLAALPAKTTGRLLALGDDVELTFGDVLCNPGDRIRHIYFPTAGFISLISRSNHQESLEVGLVGNEGMTGTALLLGVQIEPLRAVVQGAGGALRIGTAAFRQEVRDNRALYLQLNRYIYVIMHQLAQAAVCTRYHVVEARLARWLLMTGDRAHTDRFFATQELLAGMLGVRRAGVTRAASTLQHADLIHYSRGQVWISNRAGLEAAACDCYATDRETYAAVMS